MSSATLEEIKARVEYNPKTGVFVWKQTLGGKCRKGYPAGRMGTGKAAGYMRVTIGGREYKAHRLAWLFMKGEWPTQQIDHINGLPHDNRWANLRLATQSQNKANGKPYKNNTSGFKGVSWNKQAAKWQASLQANKKLIYLGRYVNIADAIDAYNKAAERYFGDYHRKS